MKSRMKYLLFLALAVACNKGEDESSFNSKEEFFKKKLSEMGTLTPIRKASLQDLENKNVLRFANTEALYNYYKKRFSVKPEKQKVRVPISKGQITMSKNQAAASTQTYGYEARSYGGIYINNICGDKYLANYNVAPLVNYMWRLDAYSHEKVYEHYGLLDMNISDISLAYNGYGSNTIVGSPQIQYNRFELAVREDVIQQEVYCHFAYQVYGEHTIQVWLPSTPEPPTFIDVYYWGGYREVS